MLSLLLALAMVVGMLPSISIVSIPAQAAEVSYVASYAGKADGSTTSGWTELTQSGNYRFDANGKMILN